MNPVLQPKGSSLCGQACLASILETTLDVAVQLVGHDHGTQTRDLVAALRKAGLRPASRLIVGEPRGLSIVKVIDPIDPKGDWHWVVFDYGIIHDPSWWAPNQGKWSSYLRVK